MKAHTAKRFGALSALLSLLVVGTACGANPVVKAQPAPDSAAAAPVETPEMQTASERVQKAEGQLDLAKKQLTAARSLLKAAEADLKAARADRDSVAMRNHAQGLAEQAGLPTQLGRAVAQQDRTQLADRDRGMGANVVPPLTTPLPVAAPHGADLNALPANLDSDLPPVASPVQLR